MANQLRKGLIEPTDIPSKELPGYMGDTYRGYMVSVRERLSVFEANRNRRFGYAELDREFFALQLRMIFELTAFAVITFQQRNEPIKKNNRKKNHALDVMKLVSNYDWIQPIDPKYVFENGHSECIFPNIKSLFSEEENFRVVHGKLGALLHEQQRPRNDNSNKLTLDEIFNYEKQLKILLGQHLLISSEGEGWYVNINYPKQPNNVLIVKTSNASKL